MTKEPLLNKHKLSEVVGVLIIALALMFAALYIFSNTINQNQTKQGQERLHEITSQSASFVNMIASEEIQTMNTIAKRLSQIDDLHNQDAINLINEFVINADFDRIAIDFISGESHTSDGFVVDISDLDYLKDIPKGETIITDLIAAKIDGRPTVSIISPIMKDGKAIAAARGTIYTESYGKILNVNIFDEEGYFHLLNSKGDYLAISDSKNAMLMNENYFEATDKLTFDKGYSGQQIKTDIKNGVSGFSAYSFEGNQRYVEYIPVGISDWFLVVMVPKEVIDSNANALRINMYIFAAVFSVIYIGILAFFLLKMKNSADKIKKMNDELLAGENRYLVLLERSDKIVFDFSFATHSIEYSKKFIDMFGYEPVTEGLPNSIIENKDVYPDDAEKISCVFEMVEKGEPSSGAELRIRSANGGYLWCYMMLTTIFSENGIPVRALGIVENIDPQKQKEQELITKAEKDNLTGLYNKAATETLIKSFLQDINNANAKHALLIIDIDDFKLVNDKLGHLYGDVVLATLAKCLLPIFAGNDVIGRIGGDEFFVFLKNIAKDDIAISKANDVCNLFRRTYSENEAICHISASIGIAIFPMHGDNFEALYKNADSALYVAKAEGKNGCRVYDPDVHVNYTSNRTEIEPAQIPTRNL